MKIGQWISTTFITYIHKQVDTVSRGAAEKMSINTLFINLAVSANQNQPKQHLTALKHNPMRNPSPMRSLRNMKHKTMIKPTKPRFQCCQESLPASFLPLFWPWTIPCFQPTIIQPNKTFNKHLKLWASIWWHTLCVLTVSQPCSFFLSLFLWVYVLCTLWELLCSTQQAGGWQGRGKGLMTQALY